MAFRKQQPIDSLQEGVRVEDVFVVKFRKGFQPYSRGHSFHLVLTDGSGRSIDYKFWGGADEGKVRALYDSIPSDGVVLVQGRVQPYQGKPQISANEPDTVRVLEPSEYDVSDFIPAARRDIDAMWRLLQDRIGELKGPDAKILLERIFYDPELSDRFKRHPGAIEIHHNWVGGLMQHTHEVCEYAMLSKRLFPELDGDILICGSLLHDIGKLDEIEVTSRIKGSRRGQLEGHIALGYARVSKVMDELKTPEPLRGKILHVILSHHGCAEYESPKPMMMPEAAAVHYGDAASSQIAEMTEYIKWARDNTDDDFMYHKRRQHNILLD